MKIIVFVEGGIVQTVMTDEEAEVMIVDYDVEDSDLPERLITLDGDKAYVYRFNTYELNVDRVNEIFALKHHEIYHEIYAPKSDIIRKAAEKAGIPVVEIWTPGVGKDDLKGIPVPKGLNFEKDGAGIPDGVLPKALTTRPESQFFIGQFCPKCHQSWATHHDDGSCIIDWEE